jgi:hypothetical protein
MRSEHMPPDMSLGEQRFLEIDIYSEREGNIRQPYEDLTCSSGG